MEETANEIKLIDYDEKLPMLKEIVKSCGSRSVKDSFSFVGLLKYRKANVNILAIENVGFLAFVRCKSHINIYEFAIAKEEQRKGFGKKLMDEAILYCRVNDIGTVKLRAIKSEPFYNFYLKYGFQIVGEKGEDYLFEMNLNEARLI